MCAGESLTHGVSGLTRRINCRRYKGTCHRVPRGAGSWLGQLWLASWIPAGQRGRVCAGISEFSPTNRRRLRGPRHRVTEPGVLRAGASVASARRWLLGGLAALQPLSGPRPHPPGPVSLSACGLFSQNSFWLDRLLGQQQFCVWGKQQRQGPRPGPERVREGWPPFEAGWPARQP